MWCRNFFLLISDFCFWCFCFCILCFWVLLIKSLPIQASWSISFVLTVSNFQALYSNPRWVTVTYCERQEVWLQLSACGCPAFSGCQLNSLCSENLCQRPDSAGVWVYFWLFIHWPSDLLILSSQNHFLCVWRVTRSISSSGKSSGGWTKYLAPAQGTGLLMLHPRTIFVSPSDLKGSCTAYSCFGWQYFFMHTKGRLIPLPSGL